MPSSDRVHQKSEHCWCGAFLDVEGSENAVLQACSHFRVEHAHRPLKVRKLCTLCGVPEGEPHKSTCPSQALGAKGIKVLTLIERRDEMRVVQWTGKWEDAHKIAGLYNDVVGFTVSEDKSLMITRRERGLSVIITKGDFIEVDGPPGRAKKIWSATEIFNKWQVVKDA